MFEILLKQYLLGGIDLDATVKKENDELDVNNVAIIIPNVLERKGLNIPPDVKKVITKEIYDDILGLYNQAKESEVKIASEKAKISEKQAEMKEFEKELGEAPVKKRNTKSK